MADVSSHSPLPARVDSKLWTVASNVGQSMTGTLSAVVAVPDDSYMSVSCCQLTVVQTLNSFCELVRPRSKFALSVSGVGTNQRSQWRP